MLQWLFLFHFVFAAPHPKYPKDVSAQQVKALLRESGREDQIKAMGPQAYKKLQELMFSSNESLTTRWQATLALAKIGNEDSLPDVQRALKSSTWFMRSSGLLALRLVSEEKGLSEAKVVLQKDPALMVRATALQVLSQQAHMDRSFLWGELYNPLNFNKGRSLSLRFSLIRTLSMKPQMSEAPKYMALLREEDLKVKSMAQKTLERIAQVKSPKSGARQITFWKNWWRDQKTNSKL